MNGTPYHVLVAREVGMIARQFARKGYKGESGDPLPFGVSIRASQWINTHRPQFKRMVARERERNPVNWERCVRDVKKRGTAVDPYAVCTASLKEIARRQGQRVKNPFPILMGIADVEGASSLKGIFGAKPQHKKRKKNPVPPQLKPFLFKKGR